MALNWLIVAQVFFINLIYIMLNTIRTLLTMRGYRNVAPIIAIIEITIYTLGLSMVMNYLQENVFYLIFYALGFGIGIYLGMLIENKIALGYSVLQIFTEDDNHALAKTLRQHGFGVTIQTGYGRDQYRLILTVLTPRTNELVLRNLVSELAPNAFYISYDAKYIQGGFWTKRIHPHKIDQASLDKLDETIIENEHVSKEDFLV